MTNLKTTKKALFTNVISLFMCIAMLTGTTFAWFTDSVSVKFNNIVSGTLGLDLLMKTKEGNWEPVGETISFESDNGSILWEPGTAYKLPALKIKNNGNLAFKYKVIVTGVTGDVDLADVIDVYDVKTDSKIGTLRDAMNSADGVEYHGSLGAGDETAGYNFVFKMQETAGNMYQGKSIENISLTVVATQYNKDAEFPVINTKDIQDAIKEGRHVNFSSDVTIDVTIEDNVLSNAYGKTSINQTNGGVIDGNGNTLSVKGANGTWDSAISTTGGTIKNLTIDSGFRGIFINHNSSHSEAVILENVTVDGPIYTINCDQGTGKGLTATNSTFNGWTSYAATIGEVEFINSNFGKANGYAFMRPYAKTTLINCNFSAGYELDSTQAEITLKDCKVGGKLITPENVTTLLGSGAQYVIVDNSI